MATLQERMAAVTTPLEELTGTIEIELVDAQDTKRFEGKTYLFRGQLDAQRTVHCKVYVPINHVDKWLGSAVTLSMADDNPHYAPAKRDASVMIVNFRDLNTGLIVDLFAPAKAEIDDVTLVFPTS